MVTLLKIFLDFMDIIEHLTDQTLVHVFVLSLCIFLFVFHFLLSQLKHTNIFDTC